MNYIPRAMLPQTSNIIHRRTPTTANYPTFERRTRVSGAGVHPRSALGFGIRWGLGFDVFFPLNLGRGRCPADIAHTGSSRPDALFSSNSPAPADSRRDDRASQPQRDRQRESGRWGDWKREKKRVRKGTGATNGRVSAVCTPTQDSRPTRFRAKSEHPKTVGSLSPEHHG